ncbi:hypothetical protein C8J57DRAFT_1228096 [Mycena rebaudengoi]|nr:hypothetical protein C8J57DRAFT_1228096 [Mycena rebaudengoi]
MDLSLGRLEEERSRAQNMNAMDQARITCRYENVVIRSTVTAIITEQGLGPCGLDDFTVNNIDRDGEWRVLTPRRSTCDDDGGSEWRWSCLDQRGIPSQKDRSNALDIIGEDEGKIICERIMWVVENHPCGDVKTGICARAVAPPARRLPAASFMEPSSQGYRRPRRPPNSTQSETKTVAESSARKRRAPAQRTHTVASSTVARSWVGKRAAHALDCAHATGPFSFMAIQCMDGQRRAIALVVRGGAGRNAASYGSVSRVASGGIAGAGGAGLEPTMAVRAKPDVALDTRAQKAWCKSHDRWRQNPVED